MFPIGQLKHKYAYQGIPITSKYITTKKKKKSAKTTFNTLFKFTQSVAF